MIRETRGPGRAAWIALAAAALAVRAVLAQRAPIIEVDGAYWAGLGAALERGDWRHGLSTAWPPLYPALIAACAAAAHGLGFAREPAVLEGSARAVSVAAGTLLLLPLFALARSACGPRVASVTVVLAAFHPRLLEYSAAALSEMTYTLLLVAALALLVTQAGAGPARGGAAREAGAGALFGAAFLARPEALPLAGAVWIAGSARHGPLRGRLRPAFALGVIALSLPWLLFLHASLGRASLGEKGEYNFWRAFAPEYAASYPPPARLAERVNDAPGVAPAEPSERVRAFEFVLRHPGLVLSRCARNLVALIAGTLPATLYAPIALLALLAPFGPRWRGAWPVLAALAAMPLLYAPFSVDRRFLVPAVPLLLVAAAAGIQWVELRLARAGAPPLRVRRGANAFLALLALLGIAYAFTRGGPGAGAPEQRAAGEWLRRSWAGSGAAGAREGPIVMARKPWVAFYAGGRIASLPDVGPDSALALARRKGADVLVADERSVRTDRPALAPLLDSERAPAGLRALHREPGPPAVTLYRIP